MCTCVCVRMQCYVFNLIYTPMATFAPLYNTRSPPFEKNERRVPPPPPRSEP